MPEGALFPAQQTAALLHTSRPRPISSGINALTMTGNMQSATLSLDSERPAGNRRGRGRAWQVSGADHRHDAARPARRAPICAADTVVQQAPPTQLGQSQAPKPALSSHVWCCSKTPGGSAYIRATAVADGMKGDAMGRGWRARWAMARLDAKA